MRHRVNAKKEFFPLIIYIFRIHRRTILLEPFLPLRPINPPPAAKSGVGGRNQFKNGILVSRKGGIIKNWWQLSTGHRAVVKAIPTKAGNPGLISGPLARIFDELEGEKGCVR